MPSLLLSIAILQLVIHLINIVSVARFNDWIHTLLQYLPTRAAQLKRQQRLALRDVVQLKREMTATSSQDEFAKWAKLRRAHDKRLAEYEQISYLNTTITTIRFASTNGLRFYLQFRYAKTPIFWVPAGWLPWYMEWFLAFPRASRGSVSIQVWAMACAAFIRSADHILNEIYVFVKTSAARIATTQQDTKAPAPKTFEAKKSQ